jgi:hypothetical protein
VEWDNREASESETLHPKIHPTCLSPHIIHGVHEIATEQGMLSYHRLCKFREHCNLSIVVHRFFSFLNTMKEVTLM